MVYCWCVCWSVCVCVSHVDDLIDRFSVVAWEVIFPITLALAPAPLTWRAAPNSASRSRRMESFTTCGRCTPEEGLSSEDGLHYRSWFYSLSRPKRLFFGCLFGFLVFFFRDELRDRWRKTKEVKQVKARTEKPEGSSSSFAVILVARAEPSVSPDRSLAAFFCVDERAPSLLTFSRSLFLAFDCSQRFKTRAPSPNSRF